ncbi:MAG: hypothetical protein EBR46_05445, partial [Betaproteobacteria bacterium]|nr:hypothetical protein [Betaproteobacteria bacterium]
DQRNQTLAQNAGLSRHGLQVLYVQAVADYEAGRFQQAAVQLFRLVALDTKREDYWALYGNTLMKMGQFEHAVTAWEMAMACTPRFRTAALIVRTALAMGMLDRSAEALLLARPHRRTPEQEREYDALVDAWYAAKG